MPKLSTRSLAYLALLLNTLVWGAALPIVKPALSFITPYQYLFYRYLFAAPLSLPILIYLLYKHRPNLKTLAAICSMELIGVTIALTFLYEGLSRTSSIEAGLIANSTPLFITLGGIFFLKEKEELHELLGLTLAVIGITIITLEPFTSGKIGLDSPSLIGNLLILGHNFFWTAYLLLAKRVYPKTSKVLIGFISLWIGLLSFGFISYLKSGTDVGTVITHLSEPSILTAALYMGVLGSIIAVPAIIIGNNLIEASEASLFSYLQPAVYIPLGVLWLSEPFSPIMAAALLLTATGVMVAETRTKRYKIPFIHHDKRPKTRRFAR